MLGEVGGELAVAERIRVEVRDQQINQLVAVSLPVCGSGHSVVEENKFVRVRDVLRDRAVAVVRLVRGRPVSFRNAARLSASSYHVFGL